ncbi:MAG: hypothetical protein K2X04_10255 [Burkholderiales bacterium]|nr:hypothetical protein [Burkholderiales bacterium]
MSPNKIFLLPVFVTLISVCSMSSPGKGSSGGDTPQPLPVVQTNGVVVDPMTSVPSLNGSSTTGVL